ncbi:hypothetical protein [Saccharothrix variisporea]|uniref:Uncharacterized protein n=1 Tax=Saccharothrix variisporea TaxID=543527 RepID=A0A495XBY1_9PSEU|nr:hypothetical protein [Saccharothrix variisporea]RKT70093.1 hypothetical protein DFJ66_3334 [Saccharothrix variisporea]
MALPFDDTTTAWAERVNALVTARRVPCLPALPADVRSQVVVPADRMGVDEFFAVAVRVGATLLYREVEVVTPEHLSGVPWTVLDGGTADDLVAEPEAYVGRAMSVRVGFAHQGVVHTWVAIAPWRAALRRAAEELARRALWPEERVAALASQLAQDRALWALQPGYSVSGVERKLADHELVGPFLASDQDRAGAAQAVALAWEQVERARAAVEERMRERLGELAEGLAFDPEFLAHDLVGDRRKDAERFLFDAGGGYTLSRTIIAELESRARKLRPKTP